MRIWRSILMVVAAALAVAALAHTPLHAGEPNQAGLVVQVAPGQVATRCISFEEDEISGADLLSRSGLTVVLDPSSFMGVTVCRIQGVGCDHPAQPCFCQCMGGSTCTYWNYYFREPGAADWTYSAMGAALRKVRPGSVEAWVWGQGDTPPPADLAYAAICAPPATEATPAPPPTAPPAPSTLVAPAASERPEATPTALVATAMPATTPVSAGSAGTGSGLSGYWPFGLMVAALAAVGLLIWRRRN